MSQSFEICIPAWNSLEYLKLCVKGIQQNSAFKHPVTVHDNASTDGTGEWLKANGINHTQSPSNEGFCGVNWALRNVCSDHVMLFNCDMYALPGWDIEILKQINIFKRHRIKNYTISSCLIEPVGNNPEYDIENFGTDFSNFDEQRLLRTFKAEKHRYMRQSTIQYSHPILMPTQMLQSMNFLDPDYFPGWAVDHDIAARAYYGVGCLNFVMLGTSRVYHFSSKTFQTLPAELRSRHCEDLFEKKWDQSVADFRTMLEIKKAYRCI